MPFLSEHQASASTAIPVSEVISALSFALDLTEGRPMGHSVRNCVLGMRLAKEIGLPKEALGDLHFALLLKDVGCSSNSSRLFQILGTDEIRAKGDLKTTDWTRTTWESLHYAITHVRTNAPFLKRVRALFGVAIRQHDQSRELVQIRCERGASIVRGIGLSEAVAGAIYSLDEHWDGKGHPRGLRGTEIPILARILNLAQTFEVFHSAKGLQAAIDTTLTRSGHWFDPDLVKAAVSCAKRGTLTAGLDDPQKSFVAPEAPDGILKSDDETLEKICLAFAEVIDAKTPFTYKHSTGVADLAGAMARHMGSSSTEVALIRRAALLHDIGKLGIPNSILEEPGTIGRDEWDVIHRHPYYSYQILRRLPMSGFIGEVSAAHHERLDGTGYFRGLTAEYLSMPSRIVAVANTYDALLATRPYRDALSRDEALRAMSDQAPDKLDPACIESLREICDQSSSSQMDTAF